MSRYPYALMGKLLTLVATAMCLPPAIGAETVYRCQMDEGRVALSQFPCDNKGEREMTKIVVKTEPRPEKSVTPTVRTLAPKAGTAPPQELFPGQVLPTSRSPMPRT